LLTVRRQNLLQQIRNRPTYAIVILVVEITDVSLHKLETVRILGNTCRLFVVRNQVGIPRQKLASIGFGARQLVR